MQSVRLLWEQHKDSGAFQAIVPQEFDRALATLSSEVMQHEAEVPVPPPPPSSPHTHMTAVHSVIQELLYPFLCLSQHRSCNTHLVSNRSNCNSQPVSFCF